MREHFISFGNDEMFCASCFSHFFKDTLPLQNLLGAAAGCQVIGISAGMTRQRNRLH